MTSRLFRIRTDLPNVLTLSRIAAVLLLVALVTIRTRAGDLTACLVFAAVAITDYFDGKLAPSRRQHLGFLSISVISEAMLWIAAALTLITGWDYLTAGWRHAVTPRTPGSSATE